jgi:hypothetical protein
LVLPCTPCAALYCLVGLPSWDALCCMYCLVLLASTISSDTRLLSEQDRTTPRCRWAVSGEVQAVDLLCEVIASEARVGTAQRSQQAGTCTAVRELTMHIQRAGACTALCRAMAPAGVCSQQQALTLDEHQTHSSGSCAALDVVIAMLSACWPCASRRVVPFLQAPASKF